MTSATGGRRARSPASRARRSSRTTGAVLAIHRSGVYRPAASVQADPDGLSDVGWYAEVLREQVGRSRRDDRERDLRSGGGIHAPLHGPVTAPYEDQVGTATDGVADPLRRLPALGH